MLRIPPIKRFQAIALVVLAVYGVGGVLGYGLHKLWHCDHCHTSASSCHSTDSCAVRDNTSDSSACECGCSSVGHDTSKDEKGFVRSHHNCPICAFLAQAQSPVFQVATTDYVEIVVCQIAANEQIGPLFLLSNHFARGPPQC